MCFHYIISVWDKGAHLVTVAYFEKQTWKQCLLCDKQVLYTFPCDVWLTERLSSAKKKHLIAGYHHDKQLSQCKRRQYSALLYISIIQVIGPSLHKRRKVLILSQWHRTTLQWGRSWREWSYIVPFHLQQWKIIFIN